MYVSSKIEKKNFVLANHIFAIYESGVLKGLICMGMLAWYAIGANMQWSLRN